MAVTSLYLRGSSGHLLYSHAVFGHNLGTSNRRKADAEIQAKHRAKLKEQAEAEAKESPKSRDTNVITSTDYPTSRERHVTLEGRGKEEAEARTKEPTNSEQSFDSNTGEVFGPASDHWNTSDPWGNQESSSLDPAAAFRQAGGSL
ncbi:hypothetical protein [Glutamicibacter creatinolyticus]|uniref:hypothetical protein n=1 Tax=Glutamicibacter creatinolyticus TaxID=162496 RepID=UPI001110E3F8|nr:hypothetical protein [Glutamicibacter creatinolyticus]